MMSLIAARTHIITWWMVAGIIAFYVILWASYRPDYTPKD